MKRSFTHIALGLCLLVCSTSLAFAIPQGPSRVPQSGSERVSKLFSAFRSGKYSDQEIKGLGWGDVPALLRLTTSTTTLSSFPTNGLSSMYVGRTTEGLIALWLIEGIRTNKLPCASLNPLLPPFNQGQDYEQVSESRQAKAAEAYDSWWKRVKSLRASQAAKVNPLKGTGFSWYGEGLGY
ncbi:MAG: DUF4943 family protein [Fimbriimonas sp.]|nr:DUF4943 family protein [Fimbriimonas sp.]